jgi:hypothetical protein
LPASFETDNAADWSDSGPFDRYWYTTTIPWGFLRIPEVGVVLFAQMSKSSLAGS